MDEMQKGIIQETADYVRKKFENERSGHDWWHIKRVWNNSRVIGEKEEADMFIVELAALLHDIADFKEYGGDITKGPKVAREFLELKKVDDETISKICEIIESLSFKGKNHENPMKTKEGQIVRDSDRLDAMGAMGIARCFTYGGSKGKPIYDPEKGESEFDNVEEYVKKGSNSQIHHFYEKLLLLKDLMLTKTGRKIAEGRHKFMEMYLKQFYSEWDGEK